MKQEYVSVIISTYNRADLLLRAINSVLNQTFQNFEIIVVDDASIDNTEKVVREFQKKDKRIRYFRLENNFGGAARPKNIGINNSFGEYIATLDSDDEWLPKKLEKQLELFRLSENRKLAFMSCNALQIKVNNKSNIIYKIPRYKNILENILAYDYMGSGSGMMYKRFLFDEIGLFDENLLSGQDWEFRIRLAQKYDFDFIEEPLFKYYIHKENISNALGVNKKEEDLNYIFNKYKEFYYKYPKVYSNRLRYNGTRYVLIGKEREGRKSFFKSIRIYPLNFKSYLYFLLSFLGPRLYSKLAEIKAKINK